ncbi:Protein of unknown function [Gryllus bimaculatus]|nr:Protein of unknown function [Gryllus bimaculatus]
MQCLMSNMAAVFLPWLFLVQQLPPQVASRGSSPGGIEVSKDWPHSAEQVMMPYVNSSWDTSMGVCMPNPCAEDFIPLRTKDTKKTRCELWPSLKCTPIFFPLFDPAIGLYVPLCDSGERGVIRPPSRPQRLLTHSRDSARPRREQRFRRREDRTAWGRSHAIASANRDLQSRDCSAAAEAAAAAALGHAKEEAQSGAFR